MKLIQLLKKIWNWLDGKKTTIACIYWTVVVPGMTVIWPTNPPANVSKTVMIVGLIFSALGLGHAAIKKYFPGTDNSSDTTDIG